MAIALGFSILLNVGLALLVVLRELQHEEYEKQMHHLTKSLQSELMDYIRAGRLL
jgi:hypothetical protein